MVWRQSKEALLIMRTEAKGTNFFFWFMSKREGRNALIQASMGHVARASDVMFSLILYEWLCAELKGVD